MRPISALDVRCPVFKMLFQTKARPLTGAGFLFFLLYVLGWSFRQVHLGM